MIDLPVVPGRVAGLPRDVRGYPVPAENGWVRGKPQLALQDFRRAGTLWAGACCAICGLPMNGETPYRLFADDEVGPTLQDDACIRDDGPGHRECMLFSGAVCPFFVSPASRRTQGHAASPKGTKRGTRASLIGFRQVLLRVEEEAPHLVSFNYRGVVENLSFELGKELHAQLRPSDPPRGTAAVRRYWKTEPEIKRAWAQTLQQARQHGVASHLGH
ncbi:hypothetical protein [Streptomyces sp. NPDC054863]